MSDFQTVAAVYDRRPGETALIERRYSGFVRQLFALPVRVLDALLWLYQRTASPALSALSPNMGCRFAPSCSHYARGALREHGLFAGLRLTVVRLAKCGPWHPGGEDPVPSRKFSCSRFSSVGAQQAAPSAPLSTGRSKPAPLPTS